MEVISVKTLVIDGNHRYYYFLSLVNKKHYFFKTILKVVPLLISELFTKILPP